MDKLRKECGVFGIFQTQLEDLARSLAIMDFCIAALQRTESCGIVVNDDGLFLRIWD